MPILKNARHERFAQALATGETADAAYVKAGYSESRSAASRLSTNVNIQARVEEILGRGAEKAAVTQEMVLRELAKIGFSDIRKAVKWGEGIGVTNEAGEIVIAHGVSLIGSADLDDETAAAIAEVSQTKDGLKVKLYDKKSALVDLGKHLGMFKDDDKPGMHVTVNISGKDVDLL